MQLLCGIFLGFLGLYSVHNLFKSFQPAEDSPRLVVGGLLPAGPPCSLYVGMSQSVHQRSEPHDVSLFCFHLFS